MRYDDGYGGRERWRRQSEPGNQSPDARYAPFRGHSVDDVHTRHAGERSGWRERGDFATKPLTGHNEVDPRVNLYPRRGETDFLGRPYGAAAFQDIPRGLYDQDHRQAAPGGRYDRDLVARGYDRAMRGYDRGMRGVAGYGRDFGAMRGYDRGFGRTGGRYRGAGGVRPRGHGGGEGYGQDYEAVRERFGGGPMMGHAIPGEPIRPLGEPTWTNRWSRRR